jgi:hypothetical protein
LRSADPNAFCDEALEFFRVAVRRAKWRGRLRRLYHSGGLTADRSWVAALGLSSEEGRRFSAAATFGKLWSVVEATSPALLRRQLTPAQLPAQISKGRRALARIKRSALPLNQHVKTKNLMAVTTFEPRRLLHASDKEVASVVAG